MVFEERDGLSILQFFSHTIPFYLDSVGSVHQPVQDSIGDGLFSNHFIPASYGQLAGDDGGLLPVPDFNHFHQIDLLLFVQMREPKVIKDEQIGPDGTVWF